MGRVLLGQVAPSDGLSLSGNGVNVKSCSGIELQFLT